MQTQVTVGIADCAVTADMDSVLVTYALGSCVAVALFDPIVRVAGLLHVLLPDSTSADLARGRDNPFLFADTGIPLLFRKAEMLGARKSRSIVRIAGGAQMLDDKGLFNIGKRNHISVKKELWKLGVMLREERVGGTVSRSVRLETATGAFTIKETPQGTYGGARTALGGAQ